MRARSVAALLFLLACGASSDKPASRPPATEPALPASGAAVVAVADAAVFVPPDPPRWSQGTLDERIESASKAMRDSLFQDVPAMVELARLQLVRDNRVSDSDGDSDVTRGKKNAMRAVAVDDSSPAARLVLALAIAQSFRNSPGSDETRAARVRLVELCAAAIPKSEGVSEAAAKALAGFVALENGNRDAARTAFNAATALDPKLAAGWAGAGDTFRSGKDYPRAVEAYRRAAAFQADDKGIEEAVALAERGVVLELPKSTRRSSGDGGAPLAPSATAAPACQAAARAASRELCAGVDLLTRATTPKQREDAAGAIVAGYSAVRPLCGQRDPACGDHVAPALLAAGRAFRSAGLLAKSIATLRLLGSSADLPGGNESRQAAQLEIADQYFAIGVFDSAADFYERYARERGPGSEKARARAALIRSALNGSGGASATGSGAICSSPLLCGARYLLADPRWASPAARP